MAMGLVSGGGGKFRWFGDKVKAMVDKEIDKRQLAAGHAMVQKARELVPVDTGKLKASIGFTYRNSDHTLQLHADEPYALFVEYGTRFMLPHPFLRPAILAAVPFWGKSEIQLRAITASANPIPMPRANAHAIEHGNRMNAALEKRFRGRRKPVVVFHGKMGRSQTGYKPKRKERFG